ncbi:MAG: flagellar filament capping protein FliD [Desulfarculus sp.]|nr:flagellar filament capping protein FliD [Desulfarculus sp.]
MADSTISGLSSSTSDLTTTGLASGSITFTGLGSGTDFTEIVDQLVKIESINKTRMETWKKTWQAKITSMTSLNQRMDALEEAAGAMRTPNDFLARAATTSNSSVVTATGDNSAVPGAYQVTVGTDVKHIMRSAGVADSGATVVSAAGTLKLTSNGVTYNVVLAGTETLTQLRDAINAVTGANIVASVEDDGTSSKPYHLVLTSGTGGADGAITVSQNPTNFSLSPKDVAQQSSTLGVSASLAGQFTGDKASGSVATYAITVQNVTGGGVVGTDGFELSWTRSWDGGAPSAPTVISVPATYQPGDSIELENGVYVQLGSGTVANGQALNLRAYANDIDAAEMGTWTGTSAVATQGNYLGTTNKTYSFTVVTAGTLQAGGGAGTAVLRWTDSSGGTGTVSLSDSDLSYSVDEGLKLKLTAGTLVSGDIFQVNVFAPDQQRGQDKGLAQATKLVHSGFADQYVTPVTTAAASFSYTYGGQGVAVSVAANTTLSELVTLINNDSNNPGVTASIINDGMGLPTSYKLVLTGQDPGAQNQISAVSHTFSGSTFGSGGDVGGGFILSQAATNSMTKVDGYPAETDIYLQRSTNTVTGIVPGITLSLHDAGTGVITVSTDTYAVKAKIEALVNAVNYVQSFIREETKYDSSTKESGILIGNYAYYIIKTRVDSALNNSISGLVDGQDTYVNLAQVGIHTDPDNEGQWVIESTTLLEALNSDPDAVANLFVENTTKGTDGAAQRVYQEMADLTDSDTGTLNVLIKNYNEIVTNIDKRITSETKRIEAFRQHQLELFARLETTLSTLNNQAKSLESAIAKLNGNSSSSD